jgi:GNAT superfamily N-acetyltransferase
MQFLSVTTEQQFAIAQRIVAPYEKYSVSLADHIRRRSSGIYLVKRNDTSYCAVVFVKHTVLYCLPFMLTDSNDKETRQEFSAALPGFLSGIKIACVNGTAESTPLFIDALKQTGLTPKQINRYTLMTLPTTSHVPHYNNSDIVISRCTPDEVDRLLPLQEAYLKEEVIPSCRTYNVSLARLELEKSLRENAVYMLRNKQGTIISKGGTNAIGWNYVQIGGIFTIPLFRGRQYAHKLLSVLITTIEKNGRQPVLFVKQNNKRACTLYQSLGFIPEADYTISYF